MTRVERGQMTTLAVTRERLETLSARLAACGQRHRGHGMDTHQRKEGLGEER